VPRSTRKAHMVSPADAAPEEYLVTTLWMTSCAERLVAPTIPRLRSHLMVSSDQMWPDVKTCDRHRHPGQVLPVCHILIPGSATEAETEVRNELKYQSPTSTNTFIPSAFETFEPVNSRGVAIFIQLGRRLTDISACHLLVMQILTTLFKHCFF